MQGENAKKVCGFDENDIKTYSRRRSFNQQCSSVPGERLNANLLCALHQVVYAMVPIPPFSKLVLRMIKIMTDGRSVDVISGNFS